MANPEAPSHVPSPEMHQDEADVEGLLRARYLEMVRLAGVRQRTPTAFSGDSREQAAIAYEDHREVIAALARLPSRRREAIVLRYWLDLPEREIAAAMGVSLGTVNSQLSRGLAALAQVLGDR